MNSLKYKIPVGAMRLCLILAFAGFVQAQTPLKFYEQGFAFERKGDCINAIIAYQNALQLKQTSLSEKSDLLRGLGRCYTNIGEYSKALNYLEQSLSIKVRINKGSAAEVMIRLAQLHFLLGNKEKAVELSQQALPYKEAILTPRNKYSPSAATVMHNIGLIFYNVSQSSELSSKEIYLLNQFREKYHFDNYEEGANFYFQKAFDIRMALKDSRGAAQSLTAIADILKNKFLDGSEYRFQPITDWSKTLKTEGKSVSDAAYLMYERADLLFNSVKDSNGRAAALMSMAELNPEKLKKDYLSLKLYNDALSLARSTQNKRVEATILDKLMEIYRKKSPQIAVIYGKQSVTIYQKLRVNIRVLDNQTQKHFLKTVEPTYRKLADILISEGRLPEAQAVLNLLKDEEYGQLARGGDTADTVPYSQAEADVITKIENLVALERKRTELQKILSANGELSAEQNKKLEQLNLDIAAANKAFDAALDALGKAEKSAETRVDEIKGGKVLQSALTELSEKTNSGVVALYTVLGTEDEKDVSGKPIKDKQKSKFGWVIMVTENRYTAYPIDVANLDENVFAFRTALSNDRYDPKPLAEKIYTAIFRQTSPKLKKTLEQDLREYLKDYKDKTIMWSLDGVLRYIPMAALHDGKQYLVENYQTTVFTKESFVWLMNAYENNWKALGLGVSDKRPNFNALPGVKTELESIVREPQSKSGILNGSIKLNDNFKKQTFFNIVNAGAFPVVHISSHYSFDAAKPENSYLLAGDGNLTFAEIKEQQNLFKKVDLLTLSACDTGVSGNGKEAEGFAYLAQSLGAKSVIASLWKVSDAGTPELMIRFYKLRAEHPEMSKGEAFREAQLSLLGAETKDAKTSTQQKRSEIVDLSGQKIELPLFEKDAKPLFAHPHYWSSFVLIGNWR